MVHSDPKTAKRTLLGMLAGWLGEDKQEQWEKIVNKMKPEDAEKAQKIAAKQTSSEPPSDSLRSYTKWFTAEKKKRADFVKSLPTSANLNKAKDELHGMILRGGEPLSKKEVDRICGSEKAFAEYLVELTVEQLETMKQALRDNVVKLDPPMKQTLLKLFTMVQEERFMWEKERMEKLGPEIHRLQTAIMLKEKIEALEKIRKSYSTPVV